MYYCLLYCCTKYKSMAMFYAYLTFKRHRFIRISHTRAVLSIEAEHTVLPSVPNLTQVTVLV